MEKQYIMTERAHFMCPDMNFGMLLQMKGILNQEKLQGALEALAKAHPFLKALVAYEEDSERLFYDVKEKSQISIAFYKGNFQLAEYEAITKSTWNVLQEGLLRAFVYEASESFEVLLVAHHLLTDGTGLLQLARELADYYGEGKEIPYVEEKLISDLSQLPKGSELSGISRFLVNRANKQWKKEKHKVSYQTYLDFEKKYHENHKLAYESYEVSDALYQEMKKICKENDVTMNDLLMAKMYLKTGGNKIIIAADLRSKLTHYQVGALGNYATAMGIQCKSKTTDEVAKAKEVHQLVKNTMKDPKKLCLVLACYFLLEPTLLDAAAIAGMGGFESKAASFVGGGMFGFAEPASYSITNLGKIENQNLQSVLFIPPASPAAKLTLGVVTLNERMYACSSKAMR